MFFLLKENEIHLRWLEVGNEKIDVLTVELFLFQFSDLKEVIDDLG